MLETVAISPSIAGHLSLKIFNANPTVQPLSIAITASPGSSISFTIT
jgi:hypothetical protein